MTCVDGWPMEYRTGAQIADDLTVIADLLRGLPADVRLPRANVRMCPCGRACDHGAAGPVGLRVVA